MNMQGLVFIWQGAADLLKGLSRRHCPMILCESHNGGQSVSSLEAVVPFGRPALAQRLPRLPEYRFLAARREAQTNDYVFSHAHIAGHNGVLHGLFCTPARLQTKRRAK